MGVFTPSGRLLQLLVHVVPEIPGAGGSPATTEKQNE